jgi:hypothetical protein
MTASSRTGRLTPDQVQSITFPPARSGRRGLDEETVRSCCDQVQRSKSSFGSMGRVIAGDSPKAQGTPSVNNQSLLNS